MTDVKAKRAFLSAFERLGDVAAALETSGTAAETHDAWMQDRDYRAVFEAIVSDRKAGKKPPPAPPRPPVRRPRPAIAAPVEPPDTNRTQTGNNSPQSAKRRGRPPKPRDAESRTLPHPAPPPIEPERPQAEIPVSLEPVAPVIREDVYEGVKGHVRVYVREGQEAMPPDEPDAPAKPAAPEYEPQIEVSLTSNADQRRIIDEYGELDRRMQLRAMDAARYDTLKRAVKSWFDQAPADADGTVEGDAYLLHLSARERERKIADMRQVIELIGLDKFLEIAVLPIGKLEDLLGVAHVATLTTEVRSGSRRIKAIAKRAVERRATPEGHINGTAAQQDVAAVHS